MQFRTATPEDVSLVAGVLAAAAEHLRAKSLDLWSSSEVSESAVLPHINEGLYHIGFDGLEAVGVFRLQTHDPMFWPEITAGTSTYLHKLAVLPEKQGQRFAHAILSYAVCLTRKRGFSFLRLDCRSGRPKLLKVYESFGFKKHSQILLNGHAFDRFEFPIEAQDA
jgi:GNAT superfamily N-acetyltransferase